MKKLILLLLFLFALPVHAEGIAPFKAQYELYYRWFHLGSAEYTLEQLADKNYVFGFESKMRFLVYSDKRKVRSKFAFQDNQLLPIKYTHERWGTGRNYKELIQFKPKFDQISAQFRNSAKTVAYDTSIKDGLSVQLQLVMDIKRGEREFEYRIFEVFGVMQREFSYLESAKITINDVTYDCIKIEVKRPEKQFKIQMWFAKELDYLPVQLVHFVNDKKRFSAVLSQFSI